LCECGKVINPGEYYTEFVGIVYDEFIREKKGLHICNGDEQFYEECNEEEMLF